VGKLIYALELIAIVRHMEAYPGDDLDDTLRNVFDFDVYRVETAEKLDEILRKYRFVYSLLDTSCRRLSRRRLRTQSTDSLAVQKAKKKQLDMQFDPQENSLDEPKHGQEDPSGGAHSGGNTFAGGVRCLW
jgi:von Willebrand factor A domain-containing protein 8